MARKGNKRDWTKAQWYTHKDIMALEKKVFRWTLNLFIACIIDDYDRDGIIDLLETINRTIEAIADNRFHYDIQNIEDLISEYVHLKIDIDGVYDTHDTERLSNETDATAI